MQKLHTKLTQKYPKYNNWHHTKHHNKIHWGVLIVFTLLIFGIISRWTPISLAADIAAPTTPTGLTVVAISSSQINLSWIASTDDVGVAGYKIYRCAGSGCAPTVQIATSAVNSYSNTGLTASTAYTYAVSAYDAAGNESGKSTSASATTNQSGVIFEDNFDDHPDWTRQQLLFPTNNVCYSNCDTPIGWDGYYNGTSFCNGGPGHNTLNINSDNPKGGSGKSLTIWQESCYGGFADSDGQLAKNLGQNYQELYIRFYIKFSPDYQWVPTGPHKIVRAWHYRGWGTPYQFFGNGNEPGWGGNLKTYNGNIWYYTAYRCEVNYYCQGTPSYKFDVGKDQDHIPLGPIKTTMIDGNWHSMEYQVKMNTYNEATQTFNADGIHRFWLDGKPMFESTNIPFSDNGSEVDPRRGFNYISFGGNNSNRWTTDCTGTECEQWYAIDDIVISTTYIGPDDSPPDNLPPISPQNLTATAVSSSQINLSWTASTDTGGSGLVGYKIYRCAGSACAPTTQIAISAMNSYSNTGLTASTAYTYAISAFDAAGNESGKSSAVSVTTLSQFKQADFNKDGLVNQLDFDILKQDWARTDKPASDLNQDGIVDTRDLGIMMSEWRN